MKQVVDELEEAEAGIRILAEVIQAVADRERAARPTLVAIEEVGEMLERKHVSMRDWLHGLALCPSCGLPLDKNHDEHKIGPRYGLEALLVGTHRRCGAAFALEIIE